VDTPHFRWDDARYEGFGRFSVYVPDLHSADIPAVIAFLNAGPAGVPGDDELRAGAPDAPAAGG
jgi:hypothetical protein